MAYSYEKSEVQTNDQTAGNPEVAPASDRGERDREPVAVVLVCKYVRVDPCEMYFFAWLTP